MQISEAESVVMDVLWERSPRFAEEVVSELSEARQWQEATIKTLLNRLLNKGAIRADKDGRRYRYHAVLEREAWVHGQSRTLIDRLFDGRIAPMVAHFSQKQALGKQDIAELRRLLEELDDGQ
jgi:BlaI family penicillinase repressor